MSHRLAGLVALVGLSFLPVSLSAAPIPLDAPALARCIDAGIAASWKEGEVVPAPPTDDAEFVRRVYLDLTGRIPDLLDVRDFLDQSDPEKRARLIDRLLAGDRYPAHFAEVWRGWWVPTSPNPAFDRAVEEPVENWLREELRANTGYHHLVERLLSDRAPGSVAPLFRQAHGNRPETLAAATSRLLLGVRLECAQCHNHPFARWNRTHFWELAAFFSGIATGDGGPTSEAGERPREGRLGREIGIPGTGKKVLARFPDGRRPVWKDDRVSAEVLLEWTTAPDNPYLARALVNRLWLYLMGTGFVEFLDEQDDPLPGHTELLDALAEQFVIHHFDLKYLFRSILLSAAYQRTSRQTHPSQADPSRFARMRVRGLSPAQLYDSLELATGNPEAEGPLAETRRTNPLSRRMAFIQRFPNGDRRSEQKTSILQALHLMNGPLVSDATTLEHNKNLAIIAEARTVRPARRVEQLFLITLARKPGAEESARMVKYLESGGPTGDGGRALCDVFWALLNSSEFCVNH